MPKNNFVFLTFLMILSISLMPFMEFRALAQANNPVSSETVRIHRLKQTQMKKRMGLMLNLRTSLEMLKKKFLIL